MHMSGMLQSQAMFAFYLIGKALNYREMPLFHASHEKSIEIHFALGLQLVKAEHSQWEVNAQTHGPWTLRVTQSDKKRANSTMKSRGRLEAWLPKGVTMHMQSVPIDSLHFPQRKLEIGGKIDRLLREGEHIAKTLYEIAQPKVRVRPLSKCVPLGAMPT